MKKLKGMVSLEIFNLIAILALVLLFLLASANAFASQLEQKAKDEAVQMSAKRISSYIDSLAPLCAYSCYASFAVQKTFDAMEFRQNELVIISNNKSYSSAFAHPIDQLMANASDEGDSFRITISRVIR